MNYLKKEIEFLEIEDLQGTTGLKALRVTVNYLEKEETITLKEIMNVINNDD